MICSASMVRFEAHEQSCELLEDEVLQFSWNRIIGSQDAVSLLTDVQRHCTTWPRMFWLWDMSGTHLVPGDTRRALLDHSVKLPVLGISVVTTEFLVRVPVRMLLEVVALERNPKPSIRFFENRGEALTWLTGLREEAR